MFRCEARCFVGGDREYDDSVWLTDLLMLVVFVGCDREYDESVRLTDLLTDLPKDYPSSACHTQSQVWHTWIRTRDLCYLIERSSIEPRARCFVGCDREYDDSVRLIIEPRARCFVGCDREYDDSVGFTDLLKEHASSVVPWSSD
ncbi:unnamed protein product [Schistocephalus solidus]|uniref:Uncharacterized protein n=1 Tax=Schistocephalus solidus TaxID=70667 RepID=A0A183S9I2_SCHSO|nr:unnamed protein product [Schistocephalus solidus]